MLGTFVNTGAILLGSAIGGLLKKGLKDTYQTVLFQCVGLAATGIGINSVVQNLPDSTFPVLFILSLAVGTVIGTALDLDRRFHAFSAKHLSVHLGEGLATAILLFCMGTLSILGPIESAVNGDHTFLFTNATLDLITSMILAATYGFGIMLAAGVLFLWQGGIYLLAHALSGFLTPPLMSELSILGGFLILASGLSVLKIRDCKTLNMLPSLFIPVLFFLVRSAMGIS